jgi:hypothetical protein
MCASGGESDRVGPGTGQDGSSSEVVKLDSMVVAQNRENNS